jgi:hypothetical protein
VTLGLSKNMEVLRENSAIRESLAPCDGIIVQHDDELTLT